VAFGPCKGQRCFSCNPQSPRPPQHADKKTFRPDQDQQRRDKHSGFDPPAQVQPQRNDEEQGEKRFGHHRRTDREERRLKNEQGHG